MTTRVSLYIKDRLARCEFHDEDRGRCDYPATRLHFAGTLSSTQLEPNILCERHTPWLEWAKAKPLYFTIKRILTNEEAR